MALRRPGSAAVIAAASIRREPRTRGTRADARSERDGSRRADADDDDEQAHGDVAAQRSAHGSAQLPSRPERAAALRRPGRGASQPARRAVAAAAAAAIVALAGAGTFASRDALPGDPMYGVKRVAESTGYALTFGEQAKARRHLEQAQRRLDEVEGSGRPERTAAAPPPRRPKPTRMRSTMQEFDATRPRARACCSPGRRRTPRRWTTCGAWATEQSARLSEIRVGAARGPGRGRRVARAADRLLGETGALRWRSAPSCDGGHRPARDADGSVRSRRPPSCASDGRGDDEDGTAPAAPSAADARAAADSRRPPGDEPTDEDAAPRRPAPETARVTDPRADCRRPSDEPRPNVGGAPALGRRRRAAPAAAAAPVDLPPARLPHGRASRSAADGPAGEPPEPRAVRARGVCGRGGAAT